LYDIASISPLQRVFHILILRKQQTGTTGVPTNAQLALWWGKNVTMAGTSEAVTESVVKLAVHIHDTLLVDDALKGILVSDESTHGRKGIMDSMYKLEALISKTKTTGERRWCLIHLRFMVTQGYATAAEFSMRNLTGKGSSGGARTKGLLDLILFNIEIKEELFNVVLKDNPFNQFTKQNIPLLATHEGFLKVIFFFPNIMHLILLKIKITIP
jgi:hypothetical protein